MGDRKGEARVIELAAAPGRVSHLVGRAQEGDRDAFGELYRLYQPSIFRLARYSLPAGDVEDAVADTFVRAWTGLPRYRNTGAPFVAWLYGIARHVVADAHRRNRRTQPVADLPEPQLDPIDPLGESLDLAAAISELGEEYRKVVELKFFLGLTNEEVARALGKSVGAVNAIQWRALGALRRKLGPR